MPGFYDALGYFSRNPGFRMARDVLLGLIRMFFCLPRLLDFIKNNLIYMLGLSFFSGLYCFTGFLLCFGVFFRNGLARPASKSELRNTS